MLDLIQEEQRNRTVSVNEANEIHKKRFVVCPPSTLYFPYNLDIKDRGWGCAWRAIQTLISSKQGRIPFQILFSKYSKKQMLMNIAMKQAQYKETTLELLRESKWAPEQAPKNWAEPFIGSLCCWHLQLPNSLFLLNGYPKANAPSQVFSKIINFKQFFEIVRSKISNTSIMIDDGQFALSIIGYHQPDPATIEFLFADPHIASNRVAQDVGLYSKCFDLNGASKGQDTRSESQKKEALYTVYESLQFQSKEWMICFVL